MPLLFDYRGLSTTTLPIQICFDDPWERSAMITMRGIQYLTNRTNYKTRLFYSAAVVVALAALLDFSARIFVPGGAKAAAVVQNSVPVTTVSAASFIGLPSSVAKNSIVAAFGTQLATGTQIATIQPLPTS